MNGEFVAAHEICPFRVGDRVAIKRSHKFAGDWPEPLNVASVTWEYWKGDGTEINIGLALDDDLEHGHGITDGWRPDDLEPLPKFAKTIEEIIR